MPTINEVLRNELWARLSAQKVVDYLKNAGMTNVYLEKVANWKRDRVPSLEQMAEIEHAHGLPQGWILWRAGHTDLVGLNSLEGSGGVSEQPLARLALVVPSPQQMWQEFQDLRECVNVLIGEIDDLADGLKELQGR